MPELANYSRNTLVLTLCHFGDITPRLFAHLLHRYRSIEGILTATRESLGEIDGISEGTIDFIRTSVDRIDEASAIESGMVARDISLVSLLDERYPRQLEELNDPPPLLYLRGQMPERSKKSIAVIGTHTATHEGMELTSKLVKAFANADVQIISSLIGGIDTCAHLSAKSCEAPSYAVLEYGFDNLRGTDLVTLGIDIGTTGGVISEYPPDKEIMESHMQETNRMIVGMADAVVATELSESSERSLDLLDFCHQIGKLTFLTVNSHAESSTSNPAIRRALANGAIPIEGLDSVEDIVKSLV